MYVKVKWPYSRKDEELGMRIDDDPNGDTIYYTFPPMDQNRHLLHSDTLGMTEIDWLRTQIEIIIKKEQV